MTTTLLPATTTVAPITEESARVDEVASPWRGRASEAELAEWLGVAQRVADELVPTALERDRAGRAPVAEIDLLRDSGLLDLLVPSELGGRGGHWRTAFEVTRVIARADASVAQLLGYHWLNQAGIAFYGIDRERAERWFRRSSERRWAWSDSFNPTDPDLRLEWRDDHYALDGVKRFATGAASSDRILAGALAAGGPFDGKVVLFAVDARAAGVEHLDDWDHLGYRATASGSVRYTDVVIGDDDLVGVDRGTPFSSVVTPGVQLLFGNIYVGIAEGALAQARDLTLARRGAWFLSGADRYADDPIVQRVYGELVARTTAAAALAERLNRDFDDAAARGTATTADDRAALEVSIAHLKVVATEVGLEVASRVFEVTGASSTAARVGLDLPWRNIRTHSLHDPIDYKKIEVGAHFLTGAVQPVSLYT